MHVWHGCRPVLFLDLYKSFLASPTTSKRRPHLHMFCDLNKCNKQVRSGGGKPKAARSCGCCASSKCKNVCQCYEWLGYSLRRCKAWKKPRVRLLRQHPPFKHKGWSGLGMETSALGTARAVHCSRVLTLVCSKKKLAGENYEFTSPVVSTSKTNSTSWYGREHVIAANQVASRTGDEFVLLGLNVKELGSHTNIQKPPTCKFAESNHHDSHSGQGMPCTRS